jgi:hypothetical protein
MSKKRVSIFDFSLQKTSGNRVFSNWTGNNFELLFQDNFQNCSRECHCRGREWLCRETRPGHGRNPVRICLCVRNPQVLLMLQCSSNKVMTTLMVGGAVRARNLQDVVFMVQWKGFGTGVVSVLCACVFLHMLLDLLASAPGKWGPSRVWRSLTLSTFR